MQTLAPLDLDAMLPFSASGCRSYARNALLQIGVVLLLTCLCCRGTFAEDAIEFLSGARLEGKVTRIDKTAKVVTFEALLGSRAVTREFPYDKIHAVLYQGKRYVINEKSDRASDAQGPTGKDETRVKRSKSDIVALVRSAGETAPDWFKVTPLEYPETLDLNWPLKAPEGWNNQRNMGQYIWDVINPNPKRWASGVKLVHHTMSLHQGRSDLLQRDRKTLGNMYFQLFQDYPRAAYWLQSAGVDRDDPAAPELAECYWRMGNKQMALELLNSRHLRLGAIKLYGDMGDTRQAVQYAERFVRAGGRSQEAYLLAGDAYRRADQSDKAIEYYRKVVAAQDARNKEYDRRYDDRARESIAALQLMKQADVRKVADGTYREIGAGYNGPMEVEVKVSGGRIESVNVVRHREKQFYSALTDTTSQIIKKQSVQGIDTTSRATITSVAIINATAKALAQGAKEIP
jgi:uncharacterized protein with FMN-binding domain